MLTLKYKDLISGKFNFLVSFFDFEPGDIFVEILPLEEFEKNYFYEYGKSPLIFIVGPTQGWTYDRMREQGGLATAYEKEKTE